MNLLNDIETLKKDLAEKQAQLAFVSKHLPADMASRIRTCEERKTMWTLVVDCEPGDLDKLLAAFPLPAGQQYLASEDGTPVDRETALSPRHPGAAVPVHAVWRRDSEVRGAAACWTSQADGQSIRVEAQLAGVDEAQARFWAGMHPLSRVPGIKMYQAEQWLPNPKAVHVGASPKPSEMRELLKQVSAYLTKVLESEGPRRRGFAPPALLAVMASKEFGVEVHVTESSLYSATPTRRYTVSIRDIEGHNWHELNEVRQQARPNDSSDLMWFDMVEQLAA